MGEGEGGRVNGRRSEWLEGGGVSLYMDLSYFISSNCGLLCNRFLEGDTKFLFARSLSACW